MVIGFLTAPRYDNSHLIHISHGELGIRCSVIEIDRFCLIFHIVCLRKYFLERKLINFYLFIRISRWNVSWKSAYLNFILWQVNVKRLDDYSIGFWLSLIDSNMWRNLGRIIYRKILIWLVKVWIRTLESLLDDSYSIYFLTHMRFK